ncbi:MAG: phage tail tape measure protein, partial [Lachnospiraceae bacterium]
MTQKQNLIVQITAALQKQKTKMQLNKDIKSIEKNLNKLNLQGKIQPKSMQNLQKQLNKIKINPKLDPSAVKHLKKQMSEITNQNKYIKKSQAQNGKEKSSSEVTNEIVQQEARKQEAFRQTAQVQETETDKVITQQNKMKTQSKTFSSVLKESFSFLSNWINPVTLVEQAVLKVKQAFLDLKEVNTILTEISKVTELTEHQLKNLGESSFQTASTYGKKASEYLLSVQEMYHAGYQNAEELAELSLIAQGSGGMDANVANDYIIASDAAFGYAGNIEKLSRLLDGQSQVTSKNAVSMEELASATKVAGSQLANLDMGEDEISALLGTAITTTREDGETIGRAITGIVMGLQQIKGETGVVADAVNAESFQNVELLDEKALERIKDRCHSLGIELEYMQDGAKKMRNPIEILRELAKVYNSLPDDSAQKAGIVSDIGGKYRSNVFSSILSNWDKFEKMLGDYENSEGVAMDGAMKSADSWEGSL